MPYQQDLVFRLECLHIYTSRPSPPTVPVISIQKCPFLDKLPGEIRNEIYALTFADINTSLARPTTPALLQTNRQIRSEAQSAFYANATFSVPVASNLHTRENLRLGRDASLIDRQAAWAGRLVIEPAVRSMYAMQGDGARFRNVVFEVYELLDYLLTYGYRREVTGRLPKLREEGRVGKLLVKVRRAGMQREYGVDVESEYGPATKGGEQWMTQAGATGVEPRWETQDVFAVLWDVSWKGQGVVEREKTFVGLTLEQLEEIATGFRLRWADEDIEMDEEIEKHEDIEKDEDTEMAM